MRKGIDNFVEKVEEALLVLGVHMSLSWEVGGDMGDEF
jgi:hypothetical protein